MAVGPRMSMCPYMCPDMCPYMCPYVSLWSVQRLLHDRYTFFICVSLHVSLYVSLYVSVIATRLCVLLHEALAVECVLLL